MSPDRAINEIEIRLKELDARNKLSDSLPKDNYQNGLTEGEIASDISWAHALFKLMDEGVLAPQIVLQIWEIRDEVARSIKNPPEP